MKKIIVVCLASVMLLACNSKPQREFVAYGGELSEDGVIEVASLRNALGSEDSVFVTVKSTIEKTCAKKGCWMTVEDGSGKAIRVTFKDYGFFVPTEGAEEKEVVFQGYAKRKVTDVATLQHFAEDEGKSQEEIDAITEPKEELIFVAEGVRIYEPVKSTK